MESHILIGVLITTLSFSIADKAPCLKNGCSSINLYLGPRWGSKLIQYPNYPKIRGPSEQEAEQLFHTSRDLNKTLLVENNEVSANIISPQHRPVPDDISFDIDYKDTPPQEEDFTSTNISDALLKIGNVNELFFEGTLNLTNMGIKGDDLKLILSSLTEEVREGIHRLYLNQNPLNHLYSYELLLEFTRLTNLKVLGLSGTSIRGLLPFDHPSLEVLDLSNNYISQLPAYNFNFPNLQELDLSNNRLNTLFFSFSNLGNLRILSLADNDMFLMSKISLQSLNLQKLYLNNNKFHMIYQITVDPITSPDVSLYLSGNPLECDCSLQENLMNRAWPKVADWDKLMCKSQSHPEPRLVSEFSSECQGILGWIKLLPDRLDSGMNKLHFTRYGVTFHDYFIFFLGLLFAALLASLAFRMCRRSLNKDNIRSEAKATVPYTILDSKQVP